MYLTEKEKEEDYHSAIIQQIKATENVRNKYASFFSTGGHRLGHVVAGSGLERTCRQPYADDDYDAFIDWALLSIDPRRSIISNEPYPYHGLKGNFDGLVSFKEAVEHTPMKLHTVYKCGKTTGFIQGVLELLKQARIVRGSHGQLQERIIHEHVVPDTSGIASPFSLPGDSGAFIFDESGDVIGLLIGGFERKYNSYFTPVENVFRDIMQMTGASEARIFRTDVRPC